MEAAAIQPDLTEAFPESLRSHVREVLAVLPTPQPVAQMTSAQSRCMGNHSGYRLASITRNRIGEKLTRCRPSNN